MCVYMCACVYEHVCVRACAYVCMCACAYVHIYMCAIICLDSIINFFFPLLRTQPLYNACQENEEASAPTFCMFVVSTFPAGAIDGHITDLRRHSLDKACVRL